MKRYSKQIIGVPLMALLLGGGYIMTQCKHDPANLAQLDTVCFQTQVLPIFTSNCTQPGCHGKNGGEFPLTSYTEIASKVKAGKPSSSDIYNAITAKFLTQQMPPSYGLSEQQRSYIRVWILQGAKDTKCPTSSITDSTSANGEVCFSRDILPILNSSCGMSKCHNATSAKGGYVFIDYTSTKKAVIANNVSNSKLYQVITATGEDLMPPSGSLSKQNIDSIASWIKKGALNGTCTEACNLTNVTYTATIKPIITSSCVGCHNASNPQGGINITDSYIQTIGKSGLLVDVINQTNGKPLMPQGNALSSCKKSQIGAWVGAGSPLN